jgi:dTDP-4-dehydrorhamnose reductase
MKILITGTNGLLGWNLVRKLIEKKNKVIASGKGAARHSYEGNQNYQYHELDITNGEEVSRLIATTRPEVIIHAAAMTQVDECELNKIDCWNSNVTATRFIIEAAREINARVIFISAETVFDGQQGPYKEEDERSPVNYYGSTKWAAEKAVMESGLDWAIVKTVLVVGTRTDGQRQNILTWVKDKLEKGESIKMVGDLVHTPTFVEDVADGIMLVVEKNAKGIFQIATKDS